MDSTHYSFPLIAIGSYASSVLAEIWRNASTRHTLESKGVGSWQIFESSREDLFLNKALNRAQLEGANFVIHLNKDVSDIPAGAHLIVGLGGSHSAQLAMVAAAGQLPACSIYSTLPFGFDAARAQAENEQHMLEAWQEKFTAGSTMLELVDRAAYAQQHVSMVEAMRQIQDHLIQVIVSRVSQGARYVPIGQGSIDGSQTEKHELKGEWR